ncbi:hypothetical protein KDRO_C00180 [Kluyveromyces lactis]|nr:hypothetical protein KDRO_C00180 [Kluyveromyces lactis]
MLFFRKMLDLGLFAYGFILLSYLCQKVEANALTGCDAEDKFTFQGLVADYYHYPMNYTGSSCYYFDDTYKSSEYQNGGYETYGGGYISSSYDINDLSFTMDTVQNDLCPSPVYGSLPAAYNFPGTITVSNFTMLLSGYFYAPKSGEYQFKLNRADDFAYVTMGNGSTFECCQEPDTDSNPAAFELITEFDGPASNATVTLKAGVFYPLKLLLVNKWGNPGLEFQFVDADGVLHESFDDYVYYFPKDSFQYNCDMSATTTVPWTQTFTSTYTTETVYEASDDPSTTVVLIVVKTPEIQTATTEYSGWTGTNSNTIGTETITETGSNGIPTIKTVYTVETPEVQTATTVYSGRAGSVTQTIGTETITETGPNGIPTIKTIYTVETPEVQTATTEYSGWTGTNFNTIGTETVTETGSDGIPTIKTIYTVETPDVQTPTSTYIEWTSTDSDTIGWFGNSTTSDSITSGNISTDPFFSLSSVTTASNDLTTTYISGSTVTAVTSDSNTSEVATIVTTSTAPGSSLSTVTTTRNKLTSDTTATETTSENIPDSTTSGTSSTEPTFSLSTVTTASNGVTTVYTTTCPIDTTVTEKTFHEFLTSKSLDESSSTELSIVTEPKKDGTSNTERSSNTGANKDDVHSTDGTAASESTLGPSLDTSSTSDASSEAVTDHKQNRPDTETQTVASSSSSSSSSISEMVSLYEGSAVKLLATPFVAVVLALL